MANLKIGSVIISCSTCTLHSVLLLNNDDKPYLWYLSVTFLDGDFDVYLKCLMIHYISGIDNFDSSSYLGIWFEYSNLFEIFEVIYVYLLSFK